MGWPLPAADAFHRHAPRVTSEQVVEFRARALELCEEAGLKPQLRATIGYNSGRVSSGIVGDYMTEVLSMIGKARREDPRDIAAEYFRQSVEGEKHYRMVAVCGALILRRFTDEQIIAALAPCTVRSSATIHRCLASSVCPRRCAPECVAGTNVVTLAQLDAWLGPNWSVRNA